MNHHYQYFNCRKCGMTTGLDSFECCDACREHHDVVTCSYCLLTHINDSNITLILVCGDWRLICLKCYYKQISYSNSKKPRCSRCEKSIAITPQIYIDQSFIRRRYMGLDKPFYGLAVYSCDKKCSNKLKDVLTKKQGELATLLSD
jgi:hypothetical protein